MTGKRTSLGRNLSVLLGQDAREITVRGQNAAMPTTIAADKLQPGQYQPRCDIDEASLVELAESIRNQGLLQPLIVRKVSTERYEIIAGERRWRACLLAGIDEIPVLLRQVDDETAMAIALVENLQREDLNAMEQARAMHRLTAEFSLTHQQVAELLSKSRTTVSNHLRLLQLSEKVKRMLEDNQLEMGHARALLVLDDVQQNYAADLVVTKRLSVRETEALVNRIKSKRNASDSSNRSQDMTTVQYQEQLDIIAKQLQTKVSLKATSSQKGSLIIHYQDKLALEKMLSTLVRMDI